MIIIDKEEVNQILNTTVILDGRINRTSVPTTLLNCLLNVTLLTLIGMETLAHDVFFVAHAVQATAAQNAPKCGVV